MRSPDTPHDRQRFARRSRFCGRMVLTIPHLPRPQRMALLRGEQRVRITAQEEIAFQDAAEAAVAKMREMVRQGRRVVR